ncbi:hypothetical protein [Caballeronia ptereochthonis]|jgi:hypothetical protein|uniref:Uncharacterized protein n=1 Tax=Caballeronia ptereochthonis TaxID=1777144 RepID=A0A157ZRL9_9BURK|nr:hypothetical protein [Caballeronia ptereochthonis]SAK47607.1 hypothetical protein AWB83_00884 [Caballeronia ptereochthonis]
MSNSEKETKSTDTPLGNAGRGASGGDPKQGARKPNAGEIEPENRRLDQHPHQTAEVPYGSGNEPEIAGKGGLGPQDAQAPDSANKHTEPLRRN